jgi:hypothetical protein
MGIGAYVDEDPTPVEGFTRAALKALFR